MSYPIYSSLTTHLSSLTSHHSPLTTHLSPLTSHLSSLISHLSPLTSHLSPLTSSMDFTQNTYSTLLQALQAQGFSFITFAEYISYYKNKESVASGIQDNEAQSTNQPACRRQSGSLPALSWPGVTAKAGSINQSRQRQAGNQSILPEPGRQSINQPVRPLADQPTVILRHDVDLKPQNSLATAKLEHELGIKGSYYFRAVPESWDEQIIREIAALGHEVGYHYETMDTVDSRHCESRSSFVGRSNLLNQDCFAKSARNDEMRIDAAFSLFVENLNHLRQIVDVKTICMHGSPRSKYDNRDIWQKYDYRKLGIIGEPYFDMDFDQYFYLTDTGRRWDGWRVSVRDRVSQQEQWIKEGLVFKTTSQIVNAAHSGKLPPKIMITVHPQRWSNSAAPWVKELVWQNVKNMVKKIIVATNR